MLRVLLVDDVRITAEQVARGLRDEQWISHVTTAASLQEVLTCLAEQAFDVAMLSMAASRSAIILRAITETDPAPPVIVLGVADAEDHVLACAEAGAAGYLPKGGSLADLMTVVKSVARGETVCSPRIAATLLRRVATLAAARDPDSPHARLTPREREILALVEQEWSNKAIAKALSIEIRTVKNHIHNIFDKLDVRCRGDAASLARTMFGDAWPDAERERP